MRMVSDIESVVANMRRVLIVMAVVSSHLLTGCSNEQAKSGGSNEPGGANIQQRDWRQFIDKCISTVERSDAVFYRRGQRVSGKELAKQMRSYLDAILQHQTVYDPFGRNVATVLVMITTHEGIWRDGLTAKPEACEVVVGDKRITVYEWLKQELGEPVLPGEWGYVEPHGLYEADITPELLAKWERYISECIRAVREAEGYRFELRGKVYSPGELAALMEANRAKAIECLKPPPDLTPLQQELLELYSPFAVISALIRPPMPTDPAERAEGVDSLRWVTSPSGERRLLALWLEDRIGTPPPMPKLIKRKGK